MVQLKALYDDRDILLSLDFTEDPRQGESAARAIKAGFETLREEGFSAKLDGPYDLSVLLCYQREHEYGEAAAGRLLPEGSELDTARSLEVTLTEVGIEHLEKSKEPLGVRFEKLFSRIEIRSKYAYE